MADTLHHRGPDDCGVWADQQAGIALAMRRLAIRDLSPAGHQPMHSKSKRYTTVFNGEIYNYEELMRDVRATNPHITLRGHSDTELMLAAFDCWGVQNSIPRLNGMFAIAIWDNQYRTLYLARDRFGEKPLYYTTNNGTFMFASEIKALRSHPQFSSEINTSALALYLRHNCIPAPYSIYNKTNKLLPGTILTVSRQDTSREPEPFWTLRSVAENGIRNPFTGSEHDAIDELDSLLLDAVKIRMYSDVPLGAFLSGGIDSSTVVALMQKCSTLPTRTFSIGVHDNKFNEASYAAKVAKHLRTDHTEYYVTPEEAMKVVTTLPEIYDEPFSDSSQIPTFLVSKLARQHISVALTGDGGDELFGGYNRHTWGPAIWNKLNKVPTAARNIAARGISMLSPSAWDSLFQTMSPLLPRTMRVRVPGHKLHKLASIASSNSPNEMYYRLASHWMSPESVVRGAIEPETLLTRRDNPRFPSVAEEMMYLDSVTYLPDDILVKLDRAAMAVSLEGRVPLLDHRVAEFAWRLPLSMRIRGHGKWILRKVLERYVPRELFDRPKAGFGIPIGSWLRGPLRDWAESLLAEDRLHREGYLVSAPIRRRWREHISGHRNWEYHLWDVLMFQAWLETNRQTPKPGSNSVPG